MDKKWMQYALDLAKRGKGYVSPNPMVGAVVVRNKTLVAEGWHERYGENHAEVQALNKLSEDVSDCTLYVSLEPCSHYGKTPPCTKRIIESGIRKVVVAMVDPNPLVAGRGIRQLKEAGIEVTCGVLESEAQALNRSFVTFMKTKKPYVVMKTAMTLDGKIAAYTGDSKWITSEASRACVHQLRHDLTGIMVGIGTVLADDPMLNVRGIENPVHPVRIVVDTKGRIPMDSKLVKSCSEIPLIVAVGKGQVSKGTIDALEDKGVQVLQCPVKGDGIDLEELMKTLGHHGVDSLLLEGGGTLNWSMMKAGLVHEVQSFIAPKIIGGTQAKTPVEGKGFEAMSQAFELSDVQIQSIGMDVLIIGRIERKEESHVHGNH